MPFLAWIATKLGSGFVTALFGQVAAIYAKSKDTKLAGLQAVLGAETADNAAVVHGIVETNRVREAGSHSLVARVVVAVFCIPFAMHMAAITFDSTFMLGCSHYGCLGIPPLPKPYDEYEWRSLETFLLVSPVMPVLSAAASRLASRL